jgi:hypothetical protein
MAKITLTNIGSGYGTSTIHNANNDTIEAAIENTLSRDGTGPNQMGANLDMNNHRITNLPNAVNNQEPITLSQAASLNGFTIAATSGAIGAVLYPRTAAEITAGVTPTDYGYPAGDIRRYGAKIDGTTNDTTSVQSAVNSGHKVFHPGGTCIVEHVVLATGTVIHGCGAAAVFKLKSGASSPQILDTVSSKSSITLVDIGFDCNNVTSGIAVNLFAAVNVKIARCRFTSKYGVYLLGAYKNVQIHENTFDANNYGVITENSSTGQDVSLVGNTFVDCTADGIEINCPTGSAKNWIIQGNIFDNIGSNGATSGFGIGASGGTSYIDGVVISGNTFHACDHQGIHIEDGCRNVSIIGNTIKDTGNGGTQSYICGIYIAATSAGREISNVLVANNTIVGVSDQDYGIYCSGSVTLWGAQIVGNTISTSLLYGIFLGSVLRGHSVSHNTVVDSTGPGIRVLGTKGSIIGNICTVNTGTQTYGLEFNTGTDLVVDGNILTGNTTGAVLVTAGLTTSIVRNNRGYVTEASGNPSIASGSTSVTVTHGLSVTPLGRDIMVMAFSNPTNAIGSLWVSNITSTQFNINCENDPGAGGVSLVWNYRQT